MGVGHLPGFTPGGGVPHGGNAAYAKEAENDDSNSMHTEFHSCSESFESEIVHNPVHNNSVIGLQIQLHATYLHTFS